MADTLSTTSTLDNLLPTYFERFALKRLVAKTAFYQHAPQMAEHPKGNGTTVRWNGWSNFGEVTAALGEGTNPSLVAHSSRKIEGTIEQYGRGVKNSDLIDYSSSLDTVMGAVENLSDAAGRSIDIVCQIGILKSTLGQRAASTYLSAWMSAVASAFHAGSNTTNSAASWGFPVVLGITGTRLSTVHSVSASAKPSVSARISLYNIRNVVRTLRANNASEFADGYFKAIMHSDTIADLRTDPSYVDWHRELTNESMKKGDAVNPVEGCRIIQNNMIPRFVGAGGDIVRHRVHTTFIFGQGAYGVVKIGGGKGKGFEIIIKRPGPNDTSNPLNMYSTISYKFSMVCKALNVSAGRVLLTHEYA